jgi:protein-disulfide isomerase
VTVRRATLVLLVVVGCARPVRDTTTPRLEEILARLNTLREQQRGTQARLQALEEELEAMRLVNLDLATSVASLRAELVKALVAAQQQPGVTTAPPAAPVIKGRPNPTAIYSVPIDGDPVRGKRTAKVTIVVAGEYACPYCMRARPTIEALEQKYGDDVRVAWKNFVVHAQTATTASLAACAAHRQGKFWDMDAAIVAHAWDLTGATPRLRDVGLLDRENMKVLARELGLDVDQLDRDIDGDKCKADLNDDFKLLQAVGTRGTPSFYINGRFLSGAQSMSAFEVVIDEELAKASDAIKGGIKAEKYYQKAVVDGGLKKVDP